MATFQMISLTACFLGIVITIFSRLYPSEKFEKQMKTIFSLIFILSIVTPIAKNDLHLPDISETITASSDYYQSLSENTDEYFIKALENNISANLKSKLNKAEFYPLEIHTSVNISADNSISINEVRVIMQNADYSDEIKKLITENVGVNTAVTVKMKEG